MIAPRHGPKMLTKEETLRIRRQHVGPSVTLFFPEAPLKMVAGRGQFLYDEQGREFLDCINNVAHVGHGNPRVQAAVAEQLGALNTNSRFLHDSLSLYAQRLCATFPAHLSVCFLVNSGSEANDLAIRLARAHTRNKDVLCVDGAYHGHLTSTMAISPYKPNRVEAKWAHVAPLPCSYRAAPGRPAGEQYARQAAQVLEAAEARGRKLAAFIVESMISCGGQTPLPAEYLERMQELVRSRNALLICDEVQTGFGRCGEHMWAFQLAGAQVQPDIVTVGKPIGNGFPVSAVVCTRAVADSFKAAGHEYFNTFGGNPASCAAALAVLDELESRRLVENARRVGRHVLDELRRVQRQHPRFVGDVRGVGFFIGLELVQSRAGREPAPELARYLVAKMRRAQVLVSTEGKHGNVLKFKPPMVFALADARKFVGALEAALRDLESSLLEAEPAAGTELARRAESNYSSASSVSSGSWLESSLEM